MNILTDPIWSRRASPFHRIGPKRMKPPGIKLDDLPKIDVILLSHNHYDHLDIETLRNIYQKHHPTIYTALGVSHFLKRKGINGTIDMDWWDELPLKEGISLIATPARHFSGRGMFDRDTTLWCGFAIKSKQGSIFFAGDTGYASFFNKLTEKTGPVKVSLLPIGAYKPEWFMAPIHTSPADTARIHLEIGSELSIGTHFGTFPLADDGMTDPIYSLKTALINHNISADKFIVLKEGEHYEF
jgi:L-ascorbate metabolism protein UlaG (beta-lactamase superfamily)